MQALDHVDFTLHAGEIHGLLGENGAGKSTLIKVLTGVFKRDAGTIRLDGQDIDARDPADALSLGIGTVYQEVNLLPNLSVAENLFIGRQPHRFGLVRTGEMRRLAAELLAGYGLDIDVADPLGSYSVAVQQIVAIARAVDLSAKVLILDEPTASLDAHEVETLFEILRDLEEPRHRHRLRHPFPRSGLCGLRPDHRAAQRAPRRHRARLPNCRASSSCR